MFVSFALFHVLLVSRILTCCDYFCSPFRNVLPSAPTCRRRLDFTSELEGLHLDFRIIDKLCSDWLRGWSRWDSSAGGRARRYYPLDLLDCRAYWRFPYQLLIPLSPHSGVTYFLHFIRRRSPFFAYFTSHLQFRNQPLSFSTLCTTPMCRYNARWILFTIKLTWKKYQWI